MSRRSNKTPSVALFPFLAVLVCTMGALIFLLLVTTRMIRDRAVAQAAFEATPAAPALPLLNIEPPEPPRVEPEPIVIPAAPEAEPESAEPIFDVRAKALADRQRELDELIARWKARANDLAAQRDERARALAQQKRLQKTTAQRNAAMQSELRDLETKLGTMTGELSVSAMSNGTAKERIDLERQIAELKRRLAAAQATQSSDPKFMVVPFDVHSGTARRPILIECTSTGLRFIPEDVSITPADLAGFTPRVNPLIAGASALVSYWTAYNVRQPNPAREPEPYVLLLVRPSGTIAYYVAMKMLSDLKQPHGYELIEEDTELQQPELDVGAKAACEAAVRRLLAERNQVLRSAVGGSGGFGIGRGGGASSGSIIGSSGGGALSGDNSNHFELEDITGKDDVGNRSWERVENFEGRTPRGVAPGQPAPGSFGAPRGTPPAARGTAGSNDGGGRKTGNGSLAVVAGSPQSASRTATGDSESPTEPGQTGEAQPTGKPGSKESKSASPPESGIENLVDSGSDGAMSDSKEGQGTDPAPEIGLGSTGNPSIPVQDRRSKKSSKDRPFEPEQLAHHHWGLSAPDAAIGLEREVQIDIERDRFVVGGKHAVRVRDTDSREDIFGRLTTVIDLQARDWGEPPHGFFWKPSLRYVIADGGDKNYEQMHSLLERAGLASSKEYANSGNAKPAGTPAATAPKTAVTPEPKPPRRFFRGILR